MTILTKKPLKLLNTAVFLQQQRYLLPVSFLFYLYNGLNLSDFIFFQGIFYFVCLISEIPAGYLGDIFKRKNILIFSYLLFLSRITLWIFFKGYWIVLIGEILYGLSKSCYRGVSDGYIYDYLKTKNIENSMLKRYGKYNFFMSSGCAISAILGVALYKYFNFKILLILEFIIHTIAILLLIFLPQIPHIQVKKTTFKVHFLNIINTIITTLKNKNINLEIFYSSILVGTTSIFVWNFQPAMKLANVAIVLFGVIYFINHTTRAFASLYAQKIINIINFKKLGLLVWVCYMFSFLIIILNRIYINPVFCFISLIIICLAIGMQMAYNVSTTSLVHKYAKNKTRATTSSVNYMIAGFCSSAFLMLFKNLIDYISPSKAFLIYAICFAFVLYLPYKISKKEL
ncbi:MAG: MFS transporter [Candidatus Gastranaerophilales bacterium]|nr:MFS transporter [Candidatus Gastranaerophilales bacterium]